MLVRVLNKYFCLCKSRSNPSLEPLGHIIIHNLLEVSNNSPLVLLSLTCQHNIRFVVLLIFLNDCQVLWHQLLPMQVH